MSTPNPLLSEIETRLSAALQFLPDKPEETAASTARALWFAAAGDPRPVGIDNDLPLPSLDDQARARLEKLLSERLAGIPLAHLTGFQMFMGLQFLCSRDALVPRRETEIVARAGLDKLKSSASNSDPLRFIDLCTGSGNLGVSLAAHEPRARFVAADLSPEAVALAQKNAQRLGVADRATFRAGDLFDALTAEDKATPVDLIICNPPYISSGKVKKLPTETLDNEPHLAFDGGPFGLNILTRLINTAPSFLKPGGWLCFEVGLGQGPFVSRSLSRIEAYGAIEEFRDSEGQVRALAAQVK